MTLTFDLESGVRVTCDVGYLYANFSLPRPLCSRLRPAAQVHTHKHTHTHTHTLWTESSTWRISTMTSIMAIESDPRGADVSTGVTYVGGWSRRVGEGVSLSCCTAGPGCVNTLLFELLYCAVASVMPVNSNCNWNGLITEKSESVNCNCNFKMCSNCNFNSNWKTVTE